MVTGASTADLAIVLVDARHGVVEQTRRHAFIASLLGIRHIVVAVNKMDLVDFARSASTRSPASSASSPAADGVRDVAYIPISALHGDNVVHASERMPWYDGVRCSSTSRPSRSRATTTTAGCASPCSGSSATRSPASASTRARSPAARCARATRSSSCRRASDDHRRRRTLDGSLDSAEAPRSVTVTLADDVDVGRGDMLCGAADAPEPVRELEADVCWMADAPLRPRAIRDQARDADRARDRRRARRRPRRPHARPRRGAPRAGGERHRPRAPAPVAAARRRRVRGEPRDRGVHPHRRGDERHRRRRDGHAGRSRRPPRAPRSTSGPGATRPAGIRCGSEPACTAGPDRYLSEGCIGCCIDLAGTSRTRT